MGQIIKVGGSGTLEVKNRKVAGFTFALYGVNDAVNVTNVLADSLPDSVVLKCELIRGGKSTKIFSDRLGALHAGSNLKNSAFDLSKVGGASGMRTLLAEGVATKAISIWPYSVILGGTIDLRGDDVLRLEIQPDAACLSANITLATAYYSAEVIEDEKGSEYGTPILELYYIEAGVNNFQKSLGQNVSDVIFLQRDKTSQLSAVQVLSNYTLASKEGRISRTYYDALAYNARLYTTTAEFNDRYQSLELYSGNEIDDVSIDMALTAANVAASKNIIFCRKFVTSADLVRRAAAVDSRRSADIALKYNVGDIRHASEVLQASKSAIRSAQSRLGR